jgi:hypothetical protein
MWFHAPPVLLVTSQNVVDPFEHHQQFASSDGNISGYCSFGELVELVEFGLIMVAGPLYLYERAPPMIF